MFCASGRSYLINNVIYKNSAPYYGGGVYSDYSEMLVVNSIVWSNSHPQISGEITAEYCDIQGGYSGEGNLDVSPCFRSMDSGDFHLMALACGDPYDSPCIDMGDPAILDSLLDCSWGLGTARSDIGEFAGGDSAIVGFDVLPAQLPRQYHLYQNYPNPFNASTTIKYDLLRESPVTIEIYDILGKKVITFRYAGQPAGYHQLIWHAEELSSGIYFYKLQAGDYIETRKMILVK